MSKVGVDLYCQQNHPTVDKVTEEEEKRAGVNAQNLSINALLQVSNPHRYF
jgi:hypothetical protein